jgi:hypothetical protein
MSQYDASARPMYRALPRKASRSPFTHVAPTTAIDEMNPPGNPDAATSAAMNFAEPDMAPEIPLNEILWRSVFGPAAVMPPPKHAAFIRPKGGDVADGDADDWWEIATRKTN